MSGIVVVDTNLLLLLVVGLASRDYIPKHDRLRKDYTSDHYDLLELILAEYSEIVLLPHILAEVSSFTRQIKNPARNRIQRTFRTLIETTPELTRIPSLDGAIRDEFLALGLTDAMILHLCTLEDLRPTLVTVDRNLLDAAHAQGYDYIDFTQFL
jgi:hypothetical protein